jgi:outer membrane beta-barrel protein
MISKHSPWSPVNRHRVFRLAGFCFVAPFVFQASAASADDIFRPESRHDKQYRIAPQAFGGSMLGSSIGNTFLAGGRLLFFLNNTIGLGASYGFSRLGGSNDFGPSPKSDWIHVTYGHIELSSDGALRFGSSDPVEMDLYATLGGGAVSLADRCHPMGVLGGGVRFFPGDWLAISVDVASYLHPTHVPSGSRFDSDLAFTLGLSAFLPPNRPAASK